MSDTYYDLPPVPTVDVAQFGTLDWSIIQWCEERLRRGIKFIESQVGYDKIDDAVHEMFQYEKESLASYIPAPRLISRTRANLLAKVAEDVVAMLTDTRCFWAYTTKNPRYEVQFDLATKTAKQWYTDRLIDLRIGDVMRYYTFCGTGVAHLYYSRAIDDMMLEAEDPRNVYPVDPLTYHTFEDCLGAILRRPRTPEWIWQEFHKRVQPDTGGISGTFFGWMKRIIDGPGQRGGPLSRRSKTDYDIPGTPVTFVNTLYLKDPRTNRNGHTVRMGPWEDDKPTTPWSYEVKPGKPLYPYRRVISWSTGVLLSDGPSPYWHSKFPLIKFTMNPWPGSWFGKAPLWDCIPLQRSITSNLRVIDDHCNQVAEPAATADRNVSRAEFQKMNTRAPGLKIRTNSSSGKGIQIQPPPPLEPIIWQCVQWCEEKMMKIAGTYDPSVLASLGQLPSDDTIDTLMKTMTPAIRLRSRILEGCYKELAYQVLYNIAEFDSTTKRLARFGPQAVTQEDFDYARGTMIPDAVPDGSPGDVAALMDALGLDNPGNLYSRAKLMLMGAAVEFDPSSLLNTAAQQDLMKYFLLAKMGYISVFTLMDKVGNINFAPPNMNVPADEVSRLALQQQLGIGMMANAQGRKATDQAPPSMGVTANGPTIATT